MDFLHQLKSARQFKAASIEFDRVRNALEKIIQKNSQSTLEGKIARRNIIKCSIESGQPGLALFYFISYKFEKDANPECMERLEKFFKK